MVNGKLDEMSAITESASDVKRGKKAHEDCFSRRKGVL